MKRTKAESAGDKSTKQATRIFERTLHALDFSCNTRFECEASLRPFRLAIAGTRYSTEPGFRTCQTGTSQLSSSSLLLLSSSSSFASASLPKPSKSSSSAPSGLGIIKYPVMLVTLLSVL